MKRIKKVTLKKQKFGLFTKLSPQELIRLRGGEDPPPPPADTTIPTTGK